MQRTEQRLLYNLYRFTCAPLKEFKLIKKKSFLFFDKTFLSNKNENGK